jgi:hypothetical protein
MYTGATLRQAFKTAYFLGFLLVALRGLIGFGERERDRSDCPSDDFSGDRAGGIYLLLGGGARFSLGLGLVFDVCVF